MSAQFWRGKRVLVTGHTGFKGSWLSVWLQQMGANVLGYSLPPSPGEENLYELASVAEGMASVFGDIRDPEGPQRAFRRFEPEIVIHLAAQALVRLSYEEPRLTYDVNVMGTVNVLEAVRGCESCRVVVNVTSDKCYENREWPWSYRENERLGGHDPYSSSKACAELVTSAYRRSFFDAPGGRPVALASARAGNVIGGGDFARDRLVPDVMRALRKRTSLRVRYPDAIRPWQHVLEPLSGYLMLAEKLWTYPERYSQSWNFGPSLHDARPVRWIIERLGELWGEKVRCQTDGPSNPHEAGVLLLDSAKARAELGWQSRWTLDRALRSVTDWHRAHAAGCSMRDILVSDIDAYERAAAGDVTAREVTDSAANDLSARPAPARSDRPRAVLHPSP